jgi:hypothetical protein
MVVAAPGTDLQDILYINTQCLQFLPKDALRPLLAEFLHQQTQALILREGQRVKTHTLPLINVPQGIYRGSKAIARL